MYIVDNFLEDAKYLFNYKSRCMEEYFLRVLSKNNYNCILAMKDLIIESINTNGKFKIEKSYKYPITIEILD